MGTPDTASTGDAGNHPEPQHNAFAQELLAADPAVHDAGPSEASGTQEGASDEDRFDAG